MRHTHEQLCLDAVTELAVRYRWDGSDLGCLAGRAAEALRDGVASDPRRAATFAFSEALYHGCATAGRAREVAYAALHRYLYECALQRYPDVAEEASQDALSNVFLTFDRCRQPGAFLAFSLYALLNAANTARGQRAVGASLAEEIVLDGEPSPHVYLDALRQRIAALIADCLRRHPRARRQIDALRMKYLDGMSEEAIAAALGVKVPVVYTLRSRAVARLRRDPSCRALAAELGVLTGDARYV